MVESAGGIHKFVDNPNPMITDSGGFQVPSEPLSPSFLILLQDIFTCEYEGSGRIEGKECETDGIYCLASMFFLVLWSAVSLCIH